MTKRATAHRHRLGSPDTGFESFLYAQVKADDPDALFSVLSMLSRDELDPWLEAERLSRLPAAMAAEQLAQRLVVAEGDISATNDGSLNAARLVALLPHHDRVPISVLSSLASLKQDVNKHLPAILLGTICVLMCIVAMFTL